MNTQALGTQDHMYLLCANEGMMWKLSALSISFRCTITTSKDPLLRSQWLGLGWLLLGGAQSRAKEKRAAPLAHPVGCTFPFHKQCSGGGQNSDVCLDSISCLRFWTQEEQMFL